MTAITPAALSPAAAPPHDRRLLSSLFIINAALLTCYAAYMVILIPDQVALLDEANKETNLAIVMAASSIGAIIIHPLVGAFSDRTRSRLGRRTPWMIISAATAAVFMLFLAGSPNLLLLGVYWVIVMLALNALGTATSAIVPDRFPKERLGLVSGIIGLGVIGGMGIGVAAAGFALSNIGIGYGVFGAMILIVTLLFVFFNRDFSSRDMALEPFSWKRFFASFWVDPKRHPDFWWAFAGRFLLILAYQSVQSYILYVLRDYVGMSREESNAMSTPLVGVMLVGALATTFFVGRWSDRLRRRRIFVMISAFIMAGALALPLFFPTLGGMFALAIVFGIGYGVYMSVDTALMTEVLPAAESAAKDLGILNIATTLPQALTPVIVAVLVSVTGSYAAIFVAGIVFAVLGALTVIPIKSVR